MNIITTYSPHLAYVLERTYGFQASELPLFDQAFQFALESGGLEELDFQREKGASYNPRPARVVLILVDDEKRNDPVELIAAVLSSRKAEDDSALFELFTKTSSDLLEAMQIAIHSRKLGEELIHEPHRHNVIRVVLAHLLDRIRHLHLASPKILSTVLPNLLQDIRLLHPLANNCAPAIAHRIEHWLHRVAPKLQARISNE